MRWLVLHLRSRSVPAAAAAAAGSTLLFWSVHHATDEPRAHAILALLAALTGVAAFAPGLAGADADLDRTASIAWRPRRAAHVVAVGACVLGLLAAVGITGNPLASTAALARDVGGIAGLTALGAAGLGASRAWALPVAWAVLVLPLTRPAGPAYQTALTWMVQPVESTVATVTAATLGVAGTVVYATFGSRR